MVTDPIANMLTQIRNASNAKHPFTVTAASKQKERLLEVLKGEGFIDSYESFEDGDSKPMIKVRLSYCSDGAPVVKELHRLSRPGKRLYVGKDEIPAFRSGLGVVVVSTSQGVLTDRDARKRGLGGELICSVF